MASDPIETQQPRSAAWAWWVCGLLLLATMLNYMDRQALSLTAKRIMEEFQLNEVHYGLLESEFAIAVALGAILFGWMVDRWNVRWIYPAAVLGWSIAGLATGFVTGFAGLLACRFFLGLAEAANTPCALRVTQHILPPAKRPLGNSMLQSGISIGSAITPFIILLFVYFLDPPPVLGALVGGLSVPSADAWRYAFITIGAIGIAWLFFWLGSVRREDLAIDHGKRSTSLISILAILLVLTGLDMVVHMAAKNHLKAVDVVPGVTELMETASANSHWLPLTTKACVTVLGIAAVMRWFWKSTTDETTLPRKDFLRRYCVLIVLGVTVNLTWHFFRAWLPLFLQKQHHYSDTTTYYFIPGYNIAADVGCIGAGFVTLFLVRRGLPVGWSRLVVFAAYSVLTLLSVVVVFLPAGPLLLVLLVLIGFGALGLYPSYYSYTQEITVKGQGKVTGSLSCIIWLAMALLHESVGTSIEATKSYSLGLALAGLAPLLGLLALLLFWGKSPQDAELSAASVGGGH